MESSDAVIALELDPVQKRAEESSPSLSDIPEDLFFHEILPLLPLSSLLHLSLVNRRLHSICTSNRAWAPHVHNFLQFPRFGDDPISFNYRSHIILLRENDSEVYFRIRSNDTEGNIFWRFFFFLVFVLFGTYIFIFCSYIFVAVVTSNPSVLVALPSLFLGLCAVFSASALGVCCILLCFVPFLRDRELQKDAEWIERLRTELVLSKSRVIRQGGRRLWKGQLKASRLGATVVFDVFLLSLIVGLVLVGVVSGSSLRKEGVAGAYVGSMCFALGVVLVLEVFFVGVSHCCVLRSIAGEIEPVSNRCRLVAPNLAVFALTFLCSIPVVVISGLYADGLLSVRSPWIVMIPLFVMSCFCFCACLFIAGAGLAFLSVLNRGCKFLFDVGDPIPIAATTPLLLGLSCCCFVWTLILVPLQLTGTIGGSRFLGYIPSVVAGIWIFVCLFCLIPIRLYMAEKKVPRFGFLGE